MILIECRSVVSWCTTGRYILYTQVYIIVNKCLQDHVLSDYLICLNQISEHEYSEKIFPSRLKKTLFKVRYISSQFLKRTDDLNMLVTFT